MPGTGQGPKPGGDSDPDTSKRVTVTDSGGGRHVDVNTERESVCVLKGAILLSIVSVSFFFFLLGQVWVGWLDGMHG